MTGDRREQAVRRAMAIGLRTASPVLNSSEDAADVAQDVALDVLRSLDRLRDPDALDAWAHKIAVRHTMRALRVQRARPLSLPATDESACHRSTEDAVDHDWLITSRQALREALATLPPRQAMVLVLRYVHGLRDRDIAEALSCRRGTVNALLSRARATLREAPKLRTVLIEMETTR